MLNYIFELSDRKLSLHTYFQNYQVLFMLEDSQKILLPFWAKLILLAVQFGVQKNSLEES